MVAEQGTGGGSGSATTGVPVPSETHSSSAATAPKCGNGVGAGPLLPSSAGGPAAPSTVLPHTLTTSSTPLLSATDHHNQLHQFHHPQSHHHHFGHHARYSSPVYNAEHARMEAWLDENQEFMQDYIIRKATRQVVDAWLVNHATPSSSSSNDLLASPTHHVGGGSAATATAQANLMATAAVNGGSSATGMMAPNANSTNCSSRAGSGATTPVRKISAHEFERGGLLKPIVNTIDGTPTFLSVDTSSSTQNESQCLSGGHSVSSSGAGGSGSTGGVGPGSAGSSTSGGGCGAGSASSLGVGMTAAGRPQRLSRNELRQLDEKQLIFELVKDICNELDVRSLCHKILQNVSMLLNADRGSLFLVQGRTSHSGSADGPKRCLVSKLFDVCPRSTVEEMEHQDEVRVAWGTGIAGHVAESGEPVNIPDAYQDDRFNNEIDILTGYRTKALLCMPIKDDSGDVVAVAQVINKLDGDRFTENDEKIFSSYLQFCGIGLRNAQLYEKSQLEVKRNQVLLDLARMIFEEQSTIEHMVFRILTHMQSLIQCQRVQVLLVHEANRGSFSRVFDFEANDLREDNDSRTSPFESRFPINIGITGLVATNGGTINIPNAYEDERFDASVDDGQAFKHNAILCMAIKNSLGQIIGVIQLVNKFDNLVFTKNDENFVEAFAIFCGMGIHNTHMYEKAIVAMAKQSVTLEVLSYHASASIDDAVRLRIEKVPSAQFYQLHDFRFDDLHLEDDDTLKACLRMFLDLDLVERFHIDYEVLCRWLLSVKKNYRHVTYHNWRHAFNVAQMMFAILTETQWWKIFGEIECLGLVIACLCHDLDHRGTNNSFQIKASSPLAQLYSTSTMEHHHFDQCLMILNSPGNQILSHLSSEDYSKVIRVLEDAILSTDLAVYFRKRGPFLSAVKPSSMNPWMDEEPRSLLRAMSMTVCDLSAITKPWEIEKRVADLVTHEFFEQGDMERQELKITPIDIMNREKEDELPMMQVGFIDSICLPIYEAFAILSPKLVPLVDGVRNNKEEWLKLGSGGGGGDRNSQRNSNNSGTIATNGTGRPGRSRKMSRKNSKSSLYESNSGQGHCNGTYYAEKERNNNYNNINNNNASESQLKCKNCSPEERRPSQQEEGVLVVDGGGAREEKNQGHTMKCTVCRSNSNGYKGGNKNPPPPPSASSSPPSVVVSLGNNNCRLGSHYAGNCTSTQTPGLISGGVVVHNNHLNNVNNNINPPAAGHSIDGDSLLQLSTITIAAMTCGATTTIEDAASLINNDSCARTPKIVGKLGHLDSTHMLLSATVNHNHHELEKQHGAPQGGESASLPAALTNPKGVEWKSSNNNNHLTVNKNNTEAPSAGREASLRRRKKGSVTFCEPATIVAVGGGEGEDDAVERRREFSGQANGSLDGGGGASADVGTVSVVATE